MKSQKTENHKAKELSKDSPTPNPEVTKVLEIARIASLANKEKVYQPPKSEYNKTIP